MRDQSLLLRLNGRLDGAPCGRDRQKRKPPASDRAGERFSRHHQSTGYQAKDYESHQEFA